MVMLVHWVIALQVVTRNQRPPLGVTSVGAARVEKITVEEQGIT